ncbi:MAG TPA: Rrf2 family transcriptional regulator [Bryobacteraceae bacterium]|nr:Rrf2 family transcriptional regulator [Bryobacteraceae bacterium]
MRLAQHTDYALRMLIHAALREPELTTVPEIAEVFGLSAAHLQKVAQGLSAHGYIETVRGRAGGIRLAIPPEEIQIGKVVAVTEPDFQLAPCMHAGEGDCVIYSPCVLRKALQRASEAFLEELNRWTLSDLIQKRKPLLVALEAVRPRGIR